ncbi:MAG TPA: efflux RND transporter periplasmic adaptor subunit [Steroidobacteraceae bacterium]|nr:efflux RND transporter periplasmic adaptor subunit [Steroidobacteraceae bacterium]
MTYTVKWIAAVIAAVLIGIGVGYGIAHRRSSPAEEQTGGKAASGERKILYWHDPMVPSQKFDKPGKSPFMDMPLVPVYADEERGGDVRISAAATQNLGIRIGSVEKRAVAPRIEAVGSIGFDERLLELVQARVNGYVTRLYVKAPLERVRRGQPLAEILAQEWLAAQQEYLALLDAKSPSAQPIREAARERLTVLGVPEATIRTLESDRKSNATTTIVAPIDGIVTELSVREGSAFMAGGPLVRINGLSSVWLTAQVPESQASLVLEGASVEAHANAWPGKTFKGRVLALLPDVDLQTRTLSIRIAIDNPQFKLAPGMFASLNLTGSESTPQLVVPSEAVIVTGERSVVILAREDGAFDVADVKVGSEQQGVTTILSGLEEGQRIVLSGQFLIDSEASLKSTVNRLTGAPMPGMPGMDMKGQQDKPSESTQQERP